jgi:hypothetical protein
LRFKGIGRGETHSAAIGVAARDTAVLAILVLAGAGQVVALDLNGAGILGVGRGGVLEDGQPGLASAVADAKVDGCEVSKRLGGITPLAGLRSSIPGRVEVVLGRCGLALPGVVGTGIWDGNVLSLTWLELDGNGLGLSAGVVGTADRDDTTCVVGGCYTALAWNAEIA